MVSMEKMCQLLNDRFDNEFKVSGFEITCDGEEFTSRNENGYWWMYKEDEVDGEHLKLAYGDIEGLSITGEEFIGFYDLHTKLGGLI